MRQAYVLFGVAIDPEGMSAIEREIRDGHWRHYSSAGARELHLVIHRAMAMGIVYDRQLRAVVEVIGVECSTLRAWRG